MSFSLRLRIGGFITAALLAWPAHAALVRGSFSDGLYTAPGQLFTVRSPLGPNPRLVDGFDRGAGAVTFMDDVGQLFGVVCTPNIDILADVDIDTEVSQAILRNWFREAVFPRYFASGIPDAEILREAPGEFEGQPAWIAVLHLPGSAPSAHIDATSGEIVRGDSWRGVVVISRGGHTYMLMTEAIGTGETDFDLSPDGWDRFLPKLAMFYGGMTFQSSQPDQAKSPHLAGK